MSREVEIIEGASFPNDARDPGVARTFAEMSWIGFLDFDSCA